MTDLGFRPGDGHHPDGAVEGRDGKIHVRRSICTDFYDAGKLTQRLLGGGRSCKSGIGIPARSQPATLALHSIKQNAIDVPQFGRQTLLVEVMIFRSWWVVASQIQNADVNCCHSKIDVLAWCEALDIDGHHQLLAWLDHLWWGQSQV